MLRLDVDEGSGRSSNPIGDSHAFRGRESQDRPSLLPGGDGHGHFILSTRW